MVPNGWEVKKLGELCSLNPKKPSKPDDGIVSFIAMPQLSESGKVISTKKKPYDEVSKGFTSFVDKDVLVAKITPCFENGKGALVDNLENGMGFGSTEFHVLRAKKGTHPEFIYYLTRTKELRVKGEMNMQGSAGHRRVTADYFNAYKVVTPPYSEQRKIAKILSTWDKAITTTEKLIETSKQQKKALMQQLLTGKKRLVNPETGKAFQGEWEEVKLGDLALYRRGSFPQPYGNPEWVDEINGYPFIQVFDIDKNMKLKKATKTKISDAAVDKSVFIEAGTVIVSLQGSIGRVAITQYDAYVDRTVLLFQSFKRKMDTIYFAYAIQDLFEIEKEKAPGGTIKTITKQVLSNFTIKVPAHYEQQKIASVLTSADKEIEVLEAKLAHFKQEKKALMQQLLTGKKRVVI